jgi:tricorn protease-like protein
MTSCQGYLRHPAIAGDQVVLVEDDLWLVPAEGGPAFRLTAAGGGQPSPAVP